MIYKTLISTLLCSLSLNSFAGSRMPQPNEKLNNSIEIAKGFSTIQCQEYPSPQQKLDELKKQLKAANIQTYQARIASDGRMYSAVCGGQTGHLAVFTITEKNFKPSQALGYERYVQP